MTIIVGVDFDNTIVSYDEVMHQVALERGLIPTSLPKNKRAIRDHIRQLVNGEEKWTRLQAVVYGPRMNEAQIIEGVGSFFQLCQQRGVKTYITSHKTQFAKYDPTNTDLRQAALRWMTNHAFFEPEGLGFSYQNVFFEATRQEKISTISRLRCTHFIDDLEEVFLDPSFPPGTEKILFNLFHQDPTPSGIKIVHSWADIIAWIFREDKRRDNQ